MMQDSSQSDTQHQASTSAKGFTLTTNILPARRAKTAAMLSTKASINDESERDEVQRTGQKRPVRDSKRKATHSQIERRRREKINDRLVTLRSIVPACNAEVEERKRQRREEEEEARKIAAGEIVSTSVKGKRRRNRRKSIKAEIREQKDEELGLHKLDVLTHTIEYIYELQDRIDELDRGVKRSTPRKITDGKDEDLNKMDNEEDDDDGSEADLEMSEWKPDVRRKLSQSISPAIMTSSRDSPMFSSATNSSASAFTNLTSPMMSLSSDSPILRWDRSSKDTTASPPAAAGSRSMHILDTKRKKTHPMLSASHSVDWRLPAPAISLEEKPRLTHRHTCSGSQSHFANNSLHHVPISTPQDAHLLLNFSTSPEVLRPISAMRGQSNAASIMTPSSNSMGGSAPGGAHASLPSALLISPPLLALDAPRAASSEGK